MNRIILHKLKRAESGGWKTSKIGAALIEERSNKNTDRAGSREIGTKIAKVMKNSM